MLPVGMAVPFNMWNAGEANLFVSCQKEKKKEEENKIITILTPLLLLPVMCSCSILVATKLGDLSS